jgi:secondary thiamine-phosphate synthase enzyme
MTKITFSVITSVREQLLNITSKVSDTIGKAGILDGIAVVYVPHTTAGLTINEAADPSVAHDIVQKLSQLIPQHENYRHAEGNSDAHVKTTIVGSALYLIIENGNLVLGTWQGIFFCEFDGPRQRKVHVKVIPG